MLSVRAERGSDEQISGLQQPGAACVSAGGYNVNGRMDGRYRVAP
jgi:hypothetical protein